MEEICIQKLDSRFSILINGNPISNVEECEVKSSATNGTEIVLKIKLNESISKFLLSANSK